VTLRPIHWTQIGSWLALPAVIALVWLDTAALPPPGRLIGIGVVVLYVAWQSLESRTAAARTSFAPAPHDAGSFELYALGRAATLFTGLALPALWTSVGAWAAIGPLLLCAGIALRGVAIRALGSTYSHRVRRLEAARIVRHGPYRVIRHPSYAGMLLAHVGWVVVFCNAASVLILLALFLPAIVRRIRVEERLLLELSEYRQYASQRKRLLPGIW
jgi:protein-S-isoprenylcysteine O-methyltransferase Ste14